MNKLIIIEKSSGQLQATLGPYSLRGSCPNGFDLDTFEYHPIAISWPTPDIIIVHGNCGQEWHELTFVVKEVDYEPTKITLHKLLCI